MTKNIRKIFIKKENKTINLIKRLNYLEQYSRRPIDTIKHQAKTITVGTERKKISNNIFLEPCCGYDHTCKTSMLSYANHSHDSRGFYSDGYR